MQHLLLEIRMARLVSLVGLAVVTVTAVAVLTATRRPVKATVARTVLDGVAQAGVRYRNLAAIPSYHAPFSLN
jgi:hypothetical protein